MTEILQKDPVWNLNLSQDNADDITFGEADSTADDVSGNFDWMDGFYGGSKKKRYNKPSGKRGPNMDEIKARIGELSYRTISVSEEYKQNALDQAREKNVAADMRRNWDKHIAPTVLKNAL